MRYYLHDLFSVFKFRFIKKLITSFPFNEVNLDCLSLDLQVIHFKECKLLFDI